MQAPAHAAAERAARHSYGRLLAILSRRTRDIAAAEDALADAFAAALRTWPERGVPARPEAWLLTVARRRVGHAERHHGVQAAARATVRLLAEGAEATCTAPEAHARLPDARLALMFVCAHPAIDASVRTPLMLQTILGLDAGRIAAAFLVRPAAMSQQLVRAKRKIRDARIPFAPPGVDALAGRVDDVLAAIYAAYTVGWDAGDRQGAVPPATVSQPVGGDRDGGRSAGPAARGESMPTGGGLVEEALFLARLMAALLPDEPEPKGLLALILYSEARCAARRDAAGRYVPLSRQDPALWDRERIREAESLLIAASRGGRFGRFQTEAAIQSAHVQAAVTGRDAHAALVGLYDLLVSQTPTIGAAVARAAAHANAYGAAAGLRLLDALPGERVARYQPYWAARTHLLTLAGDDPAATEAARQRAIALTGEPAVRAFLRGGPSD